MTSISELYKNVINFFSDIDRNQKLDAKYIADALKGNLNNTNMTAFIEGYNTMKLNYMKMEVINTIKYAKSVLNDDNADIETRKQAAELLRECIQLVDDIK